MKSKIRNCTDMIYDWLNKQYNNYSGYQDELLIPISFERLSWLINSRGVDPHFNKNGYNALHAAVVTPSRMNDRFELLLSVGVDVNGIDGNDTFLNTPLHTLIANENDDGAISLIKIAHEKGVNIDFNRQDANGVSILCLAIKCRLIKLAKFLLQNYQEFEIDLDLSDMLGMAPIHYACALGLTDLVELLLECGATQTDNHDGQSLLDICDDEEDVIREILESVSISPDRDENADLNNFHDRSRQSCFMLMIPVPIPPIRIPMHKDKIDELNTALQLPLLDTQLLLQRKAQQMSEEEREFIRQQASKLSGKSLVVHILEQNKHTKTFLLSLKNKRMLIKTSPKTERLKDDQRWVPERRALEGYGSSPLIMSHDSSQKLGTRGMKSPNDQKDTDKLKFS